MNISSFATDVEKLVDPMMVGKTHYLQTKLKKLPVCLQRKIIKSATKKAGQMPFVVEPYCTFLFYEIPDPSKVQKFMPNGFIPAKSAVFVWQTVTVASRARSPMATGRPTTGERPTTTAFFPATPIP